VGPQDSHTPWTNQSGSGQPLSVRLSIGVSLPAEVATSTAIAASVCRKLRVTVRTDQPQVLPSIVGRVPVDVVQHQREGQAEPHADFTANTTAVRLSVGETIPDVVALVAIDPCLAGFEPRSATDKQWSPVRAAGGASYRD
jgi:hypothetical protein